MIQVFSKASRVFLIRLQRPIVSTTDLATPHSNQRSSSFTTMSSRRSARLDALSTKTENDTANPESVTKTAKASTRKRKEVPDTTTLPKADIAVPSTPKKKKKASTTGPPQTPTPSAISLISSPSQAHLIKPPAAHRLAVLEGTNAPLLTPETHRLISTKPLDEISPSKASVVKTTTDNILDEAIAHLIKVEPKLKLIIERNPCRVFSQEGLAEEIDPFKSLVSGIISQQVSGAAAKSIQNKFISLFTPPTFPTPSQIISSTIPHLRTAGLSQRKAEYIHGLATKFHAGEITTEFLFSATYDEVLEKLLEVRGLGKWSVEMFACFGLKRLDVFSTGDLGVQRGMAALAGRDVKRLRGAGGGKGDKAGKWKYMSEKDMVEISERFKPYRSVFMWYMWRVEDTDISTLES